MRCPKCSAAIPPASADLDLGVNRCPSCGARYKQNRKSRALYELASLTTAVLLLVVTSWVYDTYAARDARTFLDLSKADSLPWLLPGAVLFGLFFSRLARRYVRLQTVPPSIGRALTDSELAEMSALGVTYNEEYFAAGPMHFDRLADAVEFARARRNSEGGA